jgi:hypothetical protein
LLANQVFIFGAIFSVLSIAPLYFIAGWGRNRINADKTVSKLFLCWCTLLLLEYYVLGPYSFVAQYTDSYNIGYQNYLANWFEGDRFTHRYGGGQDTTTINAGLQYFQLTKIILSTLGPWAAILFHKFMIVLIGFSGSYLLARRMVGSSRAAAFAVAAIFPMTHLYLLNFSIEFGTGFAVLPLAVYTCTVAPYRRHFAWWVLGVAILVSLAQPMKIFPPLLVAVIGGMMIAGRMQLGKSAMAFGAYIIASIINWHEVLYGLVQVIGESSRGFKAEEDAINLTESLSGVTSIYAEVWIPTSLFIVSIAILFFLRDNRAWRSLAAFGWVGFSYFLAASFPWQTVGMEFFNRVEHGYIRLALPTLFVPVTAWAFCRLEDRLRERKVMGRAVNPVSLLLAMALGLIVWNKFVNATQITKFGGQVTFHGYSNLKNPAWASRDDFRVITAFDSPHPNVIASFYDLESFDGSHLINPKNWNDYWYGIRRHSLPHTSKVTRLATRAGLDWRYWNGETYDMGMFLDLDLLRIANVRFILSALPLTGDGLRLVDRPDNKKQWVRNPPSNFVNFMEYILFRLTRIFDAGKHFVYEIENSLPRVFAAQGIEIVQDNIEINERLNLIRKAGILRKAVVAQRDANKLSTAKEIQIISAKKTPDGYNIQISAPGGGILLVNTVPNSFWKAWGDGQPLQVVPANMIHLAISIPPGASNVKVRYKRPVLREVLFGG